MSLRSIRQVLRERGGFPVGQRGRISVDVSLGTRSHRVQVTEVDDWVRVQARAARIGRVADARSPSQVLDQALQLNANLELLAVGREDGWLTVHADLPADGADAEVLGAVRRVARAADRLELLWEGGDDL